MVGSWVKKVIYFIRYSSFTEKSALVVVVAAIGFSRETTMAKTNVYKCMWHMILIPSVRFDMSTWQTRTFAV
jgi:hypothetical protein